MTFILNYHKTGLHVVGFRATVKLDGKVISKHAQCVIFGSFTSGRRSRGRLSGVLKVAIINKRN